MSQANISAYYAQLAIGVIAKAGWSSSTRSAHSLVSLLDVDKNNMGRTTVLFIISLFLTLITTSVNAERASLVVDVDSGKVLHAKNVNLPSYPASLTKLMTIYLLLYHIEADKLSLQDQLTVSANAQAQTGSRLKLRAGMKISVEEVLLALIVKSANDAAVVAAEAIYGSESKFVEKMNLATDFLGMKNTVFRNATGLPDPEQVTTARDMAVLGLAIYQRFPEYFHLFASLTFSYNKRVYKTHNHFLLNYRGANGLKTGYTCHSGYNLVSSVFVDGKKLMGVILGEPTRQARDILMGKIMDEVLITRQKAEALLTLGEIRYYSDQGAREIVNSQVIANGCVPRKIAKEPLVLSSQ